jgi:hypothetical protein
MTGTLLRKLGILMVTQKFADLDKNLTDYSKRFVVGLTIVRGTVERLGTLEQTSTYATESRRNTFGKQWDSGFFAAHSRGRSITNEIVTKTISLLKIDTSVMTDLLIPGTGVYETLTQGSRVGCILSADKRQLYLVVNHSEQISFGVQPDWSGLNTARMLCFGVAGVASWMSVSALLSGKLSSGNLIGVAIAVAGLTAGRIAHLALIRSQEIWQKALELVGKP